MSVEENKSVYRVYFAAINSKDPAALRAILSPTFVGHDLPPGLPSGPESLIEFRRRINIAFPDQVGTIQDQVAEGDLVAARVAIRHTHRGTWQGIPPTGQSTETELMEFVRIEGGKVAERWVVRDQLLGVSPPAGS